MSIRKTKAAAVALLTVLTLIITLTPHNAFAVYRTSVGDAETPERFQDDYIQHNCLDISSWNGDLDKHGNIEVTFKNKNNPSVTYTQTISYMALSFSKSREKFCYIDLNDNYASSRYLKFEIKDGMIYMEKLRDDGGKAGEMEDGKPIELKDENILVIGGVTYQKYSYYKDTHPNQFKSSIFQDNERIPILSYK